MKAAGLIRNSLLTGVCIGLLTGCSWLGDWPPSNSEMAVRTAPKPPESKMEKASNAGWVAAGQTPTPSRGLSVDEAAANRIASLEQEIEGIRNQLDMMMPALTKLAEAQGDIQKVLSHVEPAAGGTAGTAGDYGQNYGERPTPIVQPPSYQPQPVPQQAAVQNTGPQPGSVAWYEQQERQSRQGQQPLQMPPQQAYQHPVQQAYQPPVQQAGVQQASYGGASSAATVTNVRFGEHANKTRLVLDTSSQVAFGYDVDNRELLMTISLQGAGWSGATQRAISNSPLVASYNVFPDGTGGQIVNIQLRQPVRVLWAQALQPGGPQGNRVVFDLAPL